MSQVKKYTNIDKEFPSMPHVLQDAIQSDFLEIKRLDAHCEKYAQACSDFPALRDATYVVFSPYITRNEHNYETFVFTDNYGAIVCHINGREMELYGLLKPCSNLCVNPEYANTHLEHAAKERIG